MDPFEIFCLTRPRVALARLRGFWDQDVRERFGGELQAALGSLLRVGAPFGILFDLREFAVQAADNVSAMVASLAPGAERQRVPVAIVADRALVRMQAARILGGGNTAVFETEEDGLAWLATGLDESSSERLQR